MYFHTVCKYIVQDIMIYITILSSQRSAKDVYEYTEESSPCLTASVVDDAVSERSWLTEKPKHKVSTYSKSRTAVLGFGKITKNLETVKKPKRAKPEGKVSEFISSTNLC